ncbi:FtsB family cell division protein [Paenibacillus jiagnxiensis]|uniref:FtsB family cell division protein n=1 Tax=Paenibacillus jiagnxiensis TaxID=3228926 RepID=UPI0033B77DCF
MRYSSASNSSASSSSNPQAGGRRRVMIWLIVVLLFAIWAIITFFTQAFSMAEQNKVLAQKEKERQAADASHKQLQYEVNRLQDPEYIGEMARSKYGLYLPEETPIINGDE